MSRRARSARLALGLVAAALVLVSAATAAGAPYRAEPAPSAPPATSAPANPLSRAAADLQSKASRAAARPPPLEMTRSEVMALARTSGRLRDWIDGKRITRWAVTPNRRTGTWTVWAMSRDAKGKEVVQAQVFIADDRAAITEVRTGPQVAWQMARGYPGAFGRAINRPVIWGALCALFFLPLVRWRRLVSLRTLDLLALLSLSISLIWFNRGEIFTSVPLQYPPLVYLGLRLAWIGWRRTRPARAPAGDVSTSEVARPPGLANWCPTWLIVTCLVVCVALRYGLNAFNSNVIDVGYAGVIGADRIEHGRAPYGTFPSDCAQCDTYGPFNYLAYVPFEAAQPWHGHWDDLPAAHGAATTFDAVALVGFLALGWLLAGWRLGAVLALAWAANPFTAFTLESNANDSLVAAALVWGLVLARRPLARGVVLALACATKFAPLILVPLWSRHPFPRAGGGRRRLLRYVAGLALGTAATAWVIALDGLSGLRVFWSRTIGYQLGRSSPFSIWGQHPDLRPVQVALTVLVLVAAVAALRWPRRLDLLRFAAVSGALVIGLEVTLTHWFYLYVPWFLPFALLALVPEWPSSIRRVAAPAPRREPEREPVVLPA